DVADARRRHPGDRGASARAARRRHRVRHDPAPPVRARPHPRAARGRRRRDGRGAREAPADPLHERSHAAQPPPDDRSLGRAPPRGALGARPVPRVGRPPDGDARGGPVRRPGARAADRRADRAPPRAPPARGRPDRRGPRPRPGGVRPARGPSRHDGRRRPARPASRGRDRERLEIRGALGLSRPPLGAARPARRRHAPAARDLRQRGHAPPVRSAGRTPSAGGLRARRQAVPPVRHAHRRAAAGRRRSAHVLVPDVPAGRGAAGAARPGHARRPPTL
ncbi:MAG: Formamidopyrimidine-DNA glycosylase, partial [uncultured Thermoleophilia bacterium]